MAMLRLLNVDHFIYDNPAQVLFSGYAVALFFSVWDLTDKKKEQQDFYMIIRLLALVVHVLNDRNSSSNERKRLHAKHALHLGCYLEVTSDFFFIFQLYYRLSFMCSFHLFYYFIRARLRRTCCEQWCMSY